MWDANLAVAKLNQQAHLTSSGHCAQFVRQAVEAGGVHLVRHVSAKDYGSSLVSVGFWALIGAQAHYVPGDVAVIQPITGHPHGHMAMFNGTHWVSDFVQQHGLYPGAAYRAAKPPFTIYRHALMDASPPARPGAATVLLA